MSANKIGTKTKQQILLRKEGIRYEKDSMLSHLL